MNTITRYLAPIAVVAMLSGCGVKQNFEQASAQVTQFHAALSSGNWQAIAAMTGPELRKEPERTRFRSMIEAVGRKLGKVTASKQVGWDANTSPEGAFVTLTMETTFERGTGTEELVFSKQADQRLALVSYNIRSQDMMVN